MDKLRSNKFRSSSVQSSALSSMARNIVMVASLAAMATLGSGCSKKLDSMDKCLGESQASAQKSSLSDKKTECKNGVSDYVKSKDGDLRPILRKDAERACVSYSRELNDTEVALKAERESARQDGERSKMGSCEKAIDVTQNRVAELMEGDIEKLLKQ